MSALNAAAQQLGVDLSRVGHKLDLSHFRSLTGASVPRSTVRIIAWEAPEGSTPLTPVKRTEARPAREQEEEGGEATERARKERKPRKREREGEKPSELRAPEDTTTEASSWAEAWFAQLLKEMGVEGTVRGTGNTERVHLEVRADKAGRIIGKRGATLGAIRHILGIAVEKRFGALVIDVDVDDDRPREQRQAEPDDRKKRRTRKKGRREDEPRRGADKGAFPEAKLKALARRAAEKALETGQTITVNLELNSYDRRVVHLEISEIDGVESQSEEREVKGDDGRTRTVKYVQVIPQRD